MSTDVRLNHQYESTERAGHAWIHSNPVGEHRKRPMFTEWLLTYYYLITAQGSRLKIKSPLTTNEFVKPLEFVFFLLFRIYKKDPWWNNFGDNKTKTLNEKRSRAKDKLLLQTAKLRATKPPRWQFRKIYEEVQEIVRDIIVVCCPHKVLSNIVISFTTGWRRPFDKFASSFSHCSS